MLQFKAGETADDNPVWLRWYRNGLPTNQWFGLVII